MTAPSPLDRAIVAALGGNSTDADDSIGGDQGETK